jgi:hypothetical protein
MHRPPHIFLPSNHMLLRWLFTQGCPSCFFSYLSNHGCKFICQALVPYISYYTSFIIIMQL